MEALDFLQDARADLYGRLPVAWVKSTEILGRAARNAGVLQDFRMEVLEASRLATQLGLLNYQRALNSFL